MSTAEKTVPTPAEVHETGLKVRQIVTSYTKCLDATIEDYPIGRSDRGLCRLQVERAAGKGYRTVRTTTDKYARWCKPKKSTYGNGVKVVVTGLGGDRDIRWLTASDQGVFLSSANWDSEALMEAPHWSQPRREARSYDVISMTYDPDTLRSEGTRSESLTHVLKADPADLCDAYDAWMEEYKVIRAILLETWA